MLESTPFNSDFDQEDGSLNDMDEKSKNLGKCTAFFGSRRKEIYLFISLFSNAMLALVLAFLLVPKAQFHGFQSQNPLKLVDPPISPGVEQEVLMPVRYGWEYYAETVAGMDEVDQNWDDLNPDIGVLSLPRDKLDEWGVQILGDDPSDPSKALVWVRAAHSLHCLKLVRQTMLQLVQGGNLTMTFGHSMHCMGALLRDIVCAADTSLPLKGNNDREDYQYVRRCRNWAAMSEWAAGRTSCITTGPDGILDTDTQDFGACASSDGVKLSAFSLPVQ